MTTRVLDRDRSAQIILLAPIAAGIVLAAFVALTAFGGGRGSGSDGVVAPLPTPRPSTPVATPAPSEDPAPSPSEAPVTTPEPEDGGSDAMPIKVDLDNATGADVYVDIADRSGLLVDAASGTPGDGMSVDPAWLLGFTTYEPARARFLHRSEGVGATWRRTSIPATSNAPLNGTRQHCNGTDTTRTALTTPQPRAGATL